MMRWGLTVATVWLLALWLASGSPGVRWQWSDIAGARSGNSSNLEERTLWTCTVRTGRLWIARYRASRPETLFHLDLGGTHFERRSYHLRMWPDWKRAPWSTPLASAASPNDAAYTWDGLHIFVPLWIPPLLTGIPAAVLWRRRLRQRRRDRAGECLRCGYKLAELPVEKASGKATCPECGT